MKIQNAKNKRGFTLMELLMVVVIIGLLTSMAVPMYKRSVEKSRVTEALSNIQAITKSEHDFYLTKSRYSKNFSDLDIRLLDKDGNEVNNDTLEGTYYTYELLDTGIAADRNNSEYTLYKDYESNNIYCLPQDHYICEEYSNVNKNICENNLSGLWHNTSSSCYGSEKERCLKEYGTDAWQNNTFCGYSNQSGANKNDRLTIGEGQTCSSNNGKCQYVTVEAGGSCENTGTTPFACVYGDFKPGSKCTTNTSSNSCSYSSFDNAVVLCKYHRWNSYCGYSSTYKNGAICVGNGGNNCLGSSFTNGSVCYANYSGSCGTLNNDGETYKSTYDATSCCCGNFCPDYASKCEDIGKTCDPQYMS